MRKETALKILLALLIWISINAKIYPQQITYTVTETTGELLTRIITDALQSANNGADVTILFAAPGLVQVNSELPKINPSKGKISFRKSPKVDKPQGLQYSAPESDTIIKNGLVLSGAGIKIRGLSFLNFNGFYKRKAILINGFGKINIDSCYFENNINSVSMYSFLGFCEIKNNHFVHNDQNGDAILYSGTNKKVDSLSTEIIIQDNIIKMDSLSFNQFAGNIFNCGIDIRLKSDSLKRENVTVKNNTISYMGAAIEVANFMSSATGGKQSDHFTGIYILSNKTSNNKSGLYLYNPLSYWKVEQNIFNNQENDCNIKSFAPGSKIEFIESQNSLGVAINNNRNDFKNTQSQNSFKIHGTGVSVIGLDLNSQVCLVDGSNGIIRDNRIKSNILSHKPVNRNYCDYKDFETDIPKPELLSAQMTAGSLKINYELSDLDAATGNFVMDFYLTNGNGDLKNYIGSHITGNIGSIQAELSLPTGIIISHGDSMAATVTSLGDLGTGTSIGTSEAVYFPVVVLSDTIPFNCNECIGSFSPAPGKKYVISSWVKEANPTWSTTSYPNPKIFIHFINHTGNSQVTGPFMAKGNIIDGWQRIEDEFFIPEGTLTMKLKLTSESGNSYYDDIRIFPVDGTMRSYVYDPITLRMMAELDERNYATFFEFDEEGKLIRTKKETERGVMTIKEYRNNLKLK